MGSATLGFDSITILNKRSDTLHNDNDWMTIVWFVNNDQGPTDVIQLAKADGDTSLDTGSVLAPCYSAVLCNDGDFVTATFVVFNLGSSDAVSQRGKAEEIGKALAKGVADAYVRVAEEFVKRGVPLGEIFAGGLDDVRPEIVDTVGVVYDDIVQPAIEKILHLFGAPPNCNGEVLHDIAVFDPRSVYPITNVPPAYTASSPHDCGLDPHTSVIFTQGRTFSVGSFPSVSSPASTTEYVPVHNRNTDLWLGSWAESPNTSYPIVSITVERSKRASGLYSVHIIERVDPVQGVVYDTGADPVSIHVLKVFAYIENVFGTVRPWVAHGVAPGSAHVFNHPIVRPDMRPASATGGALPARAGPSLEPRFVLQWSRPIAGTPIKSRAVAFPVGAVGVGVGGSILSDETDAIDLPDQHIRLCLYEIVQNGTAIGNAIRYLRAESFSYTHADVMLFHWSPVG
jgi:hypothetical protein